MTGVIHDPASTTTGHVPCVYCHEAIPVDAFTYWSDAKRLLSSSCPSCLRRVTLAVTTWQRWTRQSEETQP